MIKNNNNNSLKKQKCRTMDVTFQIAFYDDFVCFLKKVTFQIFHRRKILVTTVSAFLFQRKSKNLPLLLLIYQHVLHSGGRQI